MRLFYLFFPAEQIRQTVSAENIDGRVIGYLKILLGILFTIIANRVPNSVQIVPPNPNGVPM